MPDDDGLKVLQQWADEQRLKKATLSSDGQSLTMDGTTLDASKTYEVSHQSKSCRYTLASLFLQIVDPNQGLMPYRNSCKKHSVKDPVKALDKPIVVGKLLGQAEEQEKPEEAEIQQEPSRKKEEHRHHKREKRKEEHHDRKRKERSDKKREREPSSKEKKRRKEPMTEDQLFSNLNVVVDKRSQTGTEVQEVHAALSTEGFMITKEDVEKYKDETDQILQMEIPVGNSASILRSSSSSEKRDFARVLDLYLEAIKPQKPDKKHHQQSQQRGGGKSHLVGKKPVIIVPKGMTSPITMVNAHEFFSNSRFVPRDVQLKKAGRGPPQTTFKRKVAARLGGALVEYELMDNPKAKLGQNPKEWERVVAVIALGAAWQFKDWNEKYSNPVNLFSRTFGFYIGMEGDPIPKELLGWSVKKGKLNRDKRGLDSVTFASFWNGLDEWMAVHKRELLPQTEK